ncbi:unnamed protein product, partial [Symbiodinium sp. CCMP2456]
NFLEYRDVVESFSHENTKRRKTEVTTKGGKVDKKLVRDMEKLNLEDIKPEDWEMPDEDLGEALDDMDVDEDVKNIVMLKINKAASTQASTSQSTSGSDDESDQKKKKKLKLKILKKAKKDTKSKTSKSSSSKSGDLKDLEKTSQLGDSDGKPEFKQKIASFETAMSRDMDYFKDLSSTDATEKMLIDGARDALQKAASELGKAKKSLKMESVKSALLLSFEALKKSKAAKAYCKGGSAKRKSS